MNFLANRAWRAGIFAGLWALTAAASSSGLVRTPGLNELAVALDVQFDRQGHLVELRPHEEAEHPQAFWAAMTARLSGMKLHPVTDAQGQAVGFRTGLYVQLRVKPAGEGGGEVVVLGMSPGPLVLERAYAGYPSDIARAAGWRGEVAADCIVDRQGACGEVRVQLKPGMPDSVARWAKVTLGLWRFRPPEINGVPIQAPFSQDFQLETPDDLPIEFRQRGAGNGAWFRR